MVSCCTWNKIQTRHKSLQGHTSDHVFFISPSSFHSDHTSIHYVPQAQQASSDIEAFAAVSPFLECSSQILAQCSCSLRSQFTCHCCRWTFYLNSLHSLLDPVPLFWSILFTLLSDTMFCIYLPADYLSPLPHYNVSTKKGTLPLLFTAC